MYISVTTTSKPNEQRTKHRQTLYLLNLLKSFDHKVVLSECSIEVFGWQREAYKEGNLFL